MIVYMETIITILKVIQTMGISLGVGTSTMAVTLFFLAIRDGVISRDERSYLGITYIVLRVAMGIILVSSILIAIIGCQDYAAIFTPYFGAQVLLIGMLFLNAFLMTIHVMPSTFGPAIQASSWYSLGTLAAMYGQGIQNIDMLLFVFAYLTLIFFAVSFINAMMAYLKEKREETKS
jgi:hypothetical protein